MANEQIRGGFENDFEFDPNDFEGFDLGSFDDPTPVVNDRNPILTIGGSVVKGAANALKDTELQRSIIEKSLPDGYVRTYDAAIAAKSVIDDLAYDARSSLRQLVKTTKNTLAPLSGKISTHLPEDYAKRINSWAATGNDDNQQYDPNQFRQMEMQSVRNEIFGGWEQIRDQINSDKTKPTVTPDMAQNIYSDSIQQQLLANLYEETSKLRLNSDMNRDYHENVEIKFREKQLELSYKTLWAVTSVADLAKQQFDFSRAQIPKLVKNTGLPELVKEHNNEIAIKLLKQKSLGGAVEMFGSSFSDIGGRIVRKTRDQIQTFFKEAVGTTMRGSSLIQSMGGDDYSDVYDPNESEEDRKKRKRREGATSAASGAAEMGAEWLTGRYGRKLGEKLRSYSENNPRIARMGMAMANLFDAMPNHINDSLGGEKRSGSAIWDALRSTMGFDELKWKDNTKVRGQSLDDLGTRAVYTVHEKRAITEVIPGWLARIHNEIRMHRTGIDGLEPMSFSFESNKFEDAAESAMRIKKKFLNEDRMKRSGRDVSDVINAIDPEGKLGKEARVELTEQLSKAAYDPSKRISLETLYKNTNLSQETRDQLRQMADDLGGLGVNMGDSSTVWGEMSRDFRGSREEHERRAQIYASMRNLRSNVGSSFNDALKHVSAGELEQLMKNGIVTQNERGEYHFNQKTFSDELTNRAKQNEDFVGPTPGYARGGNVAVERSTFSKDVQPGDPPLYKRIKREFGALSLKQIEAIRDYIEKQLAGARPNLNFHRVVPKSVAKWIDDNRKSWSTILYIAREWIKLGDGVDSVNTSETPVPKNNIAGTGGPTRKGKNPLKVAGVTHEDEFVIKAASAQQPGATAFLNEFNSKGMDAVGDSRKKLLSDLMGPGGLLRKFMPGVVQSGIGHVESAVATGKQIRGMMPRIKSLMGKRGSGIMAAGMSADLERSMGPGDAANVMLQSEQITLMRELVARTPKPTKAKNDNDGDGLRDGSWQEQLKNRVKGGNKTTERQVAGKVAEKPKSIFGFLGTIATMLGGLVTTIGAWFTKIWKGGKAIFKTIKSLLQMKAAGSAMDSLGDAASGTGRNRRRRRGAGRAAGRAAARGGRTMEAANVASKFGWRGKLAGAALAAGAGYTMFGGGSDPETEAVDSESGVEAEVGPGAPGSSWLDRAGTVAGYAMDGAMIYGGAKAIGGLVGGRLAGGAAQAATSTGARAVASGAGRTALTTAGRLVGGQAIRSGLVALAGLVSAPVAIGVIAAGALAYGGYKLYKYLKSKKAYVNNWRMAQYGYSYKESDACEKIRNLEAQCLKFVSVTKGQPAQFTRGVKPEDLISIFGIDVNDKSKVARWAAWFGNRFKPVFLNSVTMYFNMTGGTNIADADDKLNDSQKKAFIEGTYISGPEGNPYHIMASPLADAESVTMDFGAVQGAYRDYTTALKDGADAESRNNAKDETDAKKSAKDESNKSWEKESKESQTSWTEKLSNGLKWGWDKFKTYGGPLGWAAAAGEAAWDFGKDAYQNGLGTAVSNASDKLQDFGAKIYDKLTGGTKANQLGVYKAFINAGFSKNQALALTAEVGRENGYQAKALWGGHIDAAKDKNGNRIANLGMISWNQDRRLRLIQRAKEAGVLAGPNQIAESQEGLDVMAKFVMEEMKGSYAKKMSGFLNNPDIDPEQAAPLLGKGYIGWAYGQDRLRGGATFDWRKHDAKRRGYLDQIKQQVGNTDVSKNALMSGASMIGFNGMNAATNKAPTKGAVTAHGNVMAGMSQVGFAGAIASAPGTVGQKVAMSQMPMLSEVGIPGVLGPVGGGIVTGNVPKGHRAIKAATSATQKANPTSTGFCAKFVANALQAAGYKFNRQNSAYQYANGPLASAGFRKIPNQGKYQIGDVMVWPAHGQGMRGGAIHGHIQIYNGRNWVSDFIQANMRPGPKYGMVTPSLWRDETLLQANIQGSVEAKGAPPNARAADDTKGDGAALKPATAARNSMPASSLVASNRGVAGLPANNGGTSYSANDPKPTSSPEYKGDYSSMPDTGTSVSTATSNALGSANIERLANEQLRTLNSMDSNILKIVQALGRMEKNAGLAQQAAAQQSGNQAGQQQSSTDPKITPPTGRGFDTLFGKQAKATPTAPIDMRS